MRLYNLLPVLFIFLAVSGCAQQGGQQGTMPTDEIVTTGEVKEFSMTAKQWEFSPSTITVNQGDTVLLHVQSIDVMHGFGISAFGINERLEPGQTADIEFVADKKGTFTFACTVPCGAGHGGMKGQLIVK